MKFMRPIFFILIVPFIIVFFKFYTDLDRITAILCSFISCLAIYKILGILDGYLNKPSNK